MVAREYTVEGHDFVDMADVVQDAVQRRWDDPSGAYNVALKENLTGLSVADNWLEARKEWKATGKAWYIPMHLDATETLPDEHHGHPHHCVCNHKIAWHFEIVNTENNRKEIVGSEHIGFWMVRRKLIEDENIPEDMVTEERIKEWIKETVKTMKSNWWWETHGEEFTEMFDAVKELDLEINTRVGSDYYDSETERYETKKLIRKKAEGSFGVTGYGMASIVWRWNHPDNPKAQIHTRGYPNDRLHLDLQFFFISKDRFQQTSDEARQERAERIEAIELRREQRRQEQQRRQEEARAEQLERNRLRLIREEEERVRLEQHWADYCQELGIPTFDESVAINDWERQFVNDIMRRIKSERFISEKQKQRLVKIVLRANEPATEKQINYIRSLGGEVEGTITKAQASKIIENLKSGEHE